MATMERSGDLRPIHCEIGWIYRGTNAIYKGKIGECRNCIAGTVYCFERVGIRGDIFF
jgi:hypothetical protein